VDFLFGFIVSLSSNTGLALHERSSHAARLDAELLSKGSPTHVKSTSGENGKVWVSGGVWNWIINKKIRESKMNFPNE
ncbi:hypothetical protein HID58_022506, partial [Brassica napus]